jgi:hypothetical protein
MGHHIDIDTTGSIDAAGRCTVQVLDIVSQVFFKSIGDNLGKSRV